jgi:hypothetical protein
MKPGMTVNVVDFAIKNLNDVEVRKQCWATLYWSVVLTNFEAVCCSGSDLSFKVSRIVCKKDCL